MLPPAQSSSPPRFPASSLEVLYEDNHLLVVNKPAGLPTMGVPAERQSLLDVAKEYVRRKYNKPGNVYLGVVSRLDAPVTGVVIIARTSKAAARLSAAFREREVQKTYWAVVAGVPDQAAATLEHYVRKDERHRRVHVAHATSPQAQRACLHYRVLRWGRELALLEVDLETGRKHQIRVQLAEVGHPIWGDRKYGSCVKFATGIALHARAVRFTHPVRQETMQLEARVPAAWRRHQQLAKLL